MFLVIFFWTPPHFWALALYREGEYARAGVPMMPVVAGQRFFGQLGSSIFGATSGTGQIEVTLDVWGSTTLSPETGT